MMTLPSESSRTVEFDRPVVAPDLIPTAIPRPRRGASGLVQPIASAAPCTDSVQCRDAGASPGTISSTLVARWRHRIVTPSKPNSRAAASICDSTAQLICGVPKPRKAQLGVVCDKTARAWILALGVRYGPQPK